MVKKVNADAITIKRLLKQGMQPIKIARLLKVSKQKVNYWKRAKIKYIQTRRKKLQPEYINKICQLAADKTTSEMSSRKITNIINEELKKTNNKVNGKAISITHPTICKYLNEKMVIRKIRKAFYLDNDQKKKRIKFCKKIINKGLKGEEIMFTDETKIDMSPFLRDSIRLTSGTQNKLKKGDLSIYNLINREEKKFENSIMIAGGISSSGLSHLILLDGTLNQFSYGQALLYYKEDIDEIKKKNNVNLLFEQDGARVHTSKTNIALLNELFKDNWFQNPPNSPDLAYPIETLWSILKNRIKKRIPKTKEELKQFIQEEWSSIPKLLLKNLCERYIDRLKKVIELKGARLEPEHLKQLGKKKEEIYIWKKPKEMQKMKIVYNDQQLLKYKRKEIAFLKKKKKEIRSEFTQKIRKYKKVKKRDLYGRSLGYVKQILERPMKTKEEKEKKLNEINTIISSLSKMTILEYLEHMKKSEKKVEEIEKKKLDEENDDESTIDEAINKILKLKNIKKNF